jgi:hypothetical protein
MLALPAAAGLLLWLKGVAVAAGIGVLGVAAVKGIPVLLSNSDAAATVSPVSTATPPVMAKPKPAQAPTAAPVPSVTATPTTTASVTAIPTATAAATAMSPSIEPAPSAETDSLAREAAMLDRARGLLGSDPGAALAALDAQAVAFPAGHMSLERELLSVEALRRLHRVSEARARGESLLRRARGSIYEDRVRAILDELPPP